MLKRIPVSQARVGMHLHKLDGAWLNHPFWRSRFTITDPADLQRLQGSDVPFVWIDVAQGLDVADPCTDAATPAARVAAPPAPAPAAAARPPAAAPQAMGDELQRAAAICKQGRQAVHRMFTEVRLGKAVDAEHCLPVVAAITESVWRNPDALISLARLKTKDDYSYMHSVAVCALMVALSRTLGHDEARSREAGLAGLLHDLGKALMPLELLNKPGKLTADEYAVMQTHVLRGHEMLAEGQGAPAAALEVCLHHHERLDGRGYPHALAGDQLGLMARMGAVCDVYDAITSNRPYKTGWDPAESLATMASWQGQFDPAILQAFVRSLGIYPVGSMVRLASGKLAIVAEPNPGSLTAPVVKVFFSTKSNLPITPVRLDLSRPGVQDRIVGRENPAQWGFPALDELWVEGEVLRRSR